MMGMLVVRRCPMNWKVAEAKQRFSEVVRAAEEKPQWIYNRDRLVAALVPADDLEQFLAWREQKDRASIADAFSELRRICTEESYELETSERRNRPNPFT
jgi:prevent-host-death family protein